MKNIILFLIIISAFGCEDKNRKDQKLRKQKEIELKKQNGIKKDSLIFVNAIALYKKRKWDSAYTIFRQIKSTDFYLEKAKRYKDTILKYNIAVPTAVSGIYIGGIYYIGSGSARRKKYLRYPDTVRTRLTKFSLRPDLFIIGIKNKVHKTSPASKTSHSRGTFVR